MRSSKTPRRDDPSFVGIGEEELAGLEPSPFFDLRGVGLERAGLAGHDQAVVGRHVVPAGAQAVAVQYRADAFAVGRRDERGAVPRLDQRGVEVVPVLPVVVHRVVAVANFGRSLLPVALRATTAPGLGDEHPERVFEVAAVLHQQFERVVDARGVGLVGVVDDRLDRLEIGEHVALDVGLAGAHPVDVA